MESKVSASLAKLTCPDARRALVRPRLFETLDAARTRPVVWVQGPPGAGKTVLLTSYLKARKLRHLWYRLDSGDGDIATFFHYLGLAVQQAAPRYRERMPVLTPEFLPGLPVFTRRYFESLCGRLKAPRLIVLDNFEQVPGETPLHEVLPEAVAALSPGITLVVLSRRPAPPAWARLHLHGELALLEPATLALTLPEAGALATQAAKTPLAPERIAEIYTQTQGWLAGLILLVAELQPGDRGAPVVRTPIPQLLFDYFAAELFEHLPEATQAALARTALLPSMTAAEAGRLSGAEEMGQILSDFERRNYFITRIPGAEPSYEYHPLFRTFLRARAQSRFAGETFRQLQRQAACLLAESGRIEPAADLYREAEDWEGLETLVLAAAPRLLAQGRHQSLAEWLAPLPAARFEQEPWLGYWQGMAQFAFDPRKAANRLEQAYERFKRLDDAQGLYGTWAALLSIITMATLDSRRATHWIAELAWLRSRYPEYPSRTLELRSLATVYFFYIAEPRQPLVSVWLARAEALLLDEPDLDLAMPVVLSIVATFAWQGEIRRAVRLLEHYAPLAEAAPPVAKLYWQLAATNLYAFHGDPDRALRFAEAGLAFAEQCGLPQFVPALCANRLCALLIAGADIGSTASELETLVQRLGPASGFVRTAVAWMRAMNAYQQGDRMAARDHAQTALDIAQAEGITIFEYFCRAILALVLYELAEDPEADRHLMAVRDFAQLSGNRYFKALCSMTEAKAQFDRGEEAGGIQSLKEALALGRAMDGVPWGLIGPKILALLYDRALRLGIEVPFVQTLIRRGRVAPPDPASAAELWPWPVKIYTLGRFAWLREGVKQGTGGKAQAKPLELLKLLIALGGRSISDATLAELLWPEAEGDTAQGNYATTLHRLRRLLQDEHALVHEDQCLSLDARRVWVDVWAFERLLNPDRELDRKTALAQSERGLKLYQGPFLKEQSAAWVLTPRERLRAKYLRHAEDLGIGLERLGELQRAIDSYLKALEIDPLAERLYLGLMRCYQRLERASDGVRAYQRCWRALSQLNMTPSPAVQILYRALIAPSS